MRIVIDETIAARAADVQAAFLDPAFYASLGELGGISPPEVRSLSAGPGRASMVIGYRFSGQLNGPARRILDPAKLTWSQVAEVELGKRRTNVTMLPDNYTGLLSFSGWYELRDEAGAGNGRGGCCCQHFEADLRVHLPLLGPLAERALAGSIRQNIAGTARLVEQYVTHLGKRGPGPITEVPDD